MTTTTRRHRSLFDYRTRSQLDDVSHGRRHGTTTRFHSTFRTSREHDQFIEKFKTRLLWSHAARCHLPGRSSQAVLRHRSWSDNLLNRLQNDLLHRHPRPRLRLSLVLRRRRQDLGRSVVFSHEFVRRWREHLHRSGSLRRRRWRPRLSQPNEPGPTRSWTRHLEDEDGLQAPRTKQRQYGPLKRQRPRHVGSLRRISHEVGGARLALGTRRRQSVQPAQRHLDAGPDVHHELHRSRLVQSPSGLSTGRQAATAEPSAPRFWSRPRQAELTELARP